MKATGNHTGAPQWSNRFRLVIGRKALDLTQEALAKQVSCALATIKKIETDERRPSHEMAQRLADCLHIADDQRDPFLRAARHLEALDELPTSIVALGAPSPTSQPAIVRSPVTLTFLFTDIAGSTRLWEQYPDAMPIALARHDVLLRQAIELHSGHVFKTVGDAFCAAIPDPHAALLAAIDAQQHLAAEPWGATGTLDVRMALHTGVVEVRDGDYFGAPLNRVARLLSLGHGGQVLISTATAELVRDRLPPAASLRNLGLQRLKDLGRPEQVFQLDVPGLMNTFPALRGSVVAPNNLPSPLNPLIGREVELAAINKQLRQASIRLLTLLGPGGTGKTRLALQVAREQLDFFPDGVWLVDLTPIRDSTLVLSTIARTLGLRESGDQPVADQLREYLQDRTLLLILDNFEQVIDAAPELARLINVAPALRILATSRETLRLAGEQIYSVPALVVAAEGSNDLLSSPAAQLFLARARAAHTDFAISSHGATMIAAICRRLEGLPLAIELAAARTRLLPLSAILERLSRPLDLLTSGARDLPTRQQTLRTTIAWSYDLLSKLEQACFRRLGVFVGGWNLAAAEAVVRERDILDLLAALIDKSLVRNVAGVENEARYTMLETIREYALEQLQANSETETVSEQHAAYFLAWAKTFDQDRNPTNDLQIINIFDRDYDNLRAALQWYQNQGNIIARAQLAIAVSWFWLLREHWYEGFAWLELILSDLSLLPIEIQQKMLRVAGQLSSALSRFDTAEAHLESSLELVQQFGNELSMADVLLAMAVTAHGKGSYTSATEYASKSLDIYRTLNNKWRIALALESLAALHGIQGNQKDATNMAEEQLALGRELGSELDVACASVNLGTIAIGRGEYSYARSVLEEALLVFQQYQLLAGISNVLNYLGQVAYTLEDYQQAEAYYAECFKLRHTSGNRRGCIAPLNGQADALRQQGKTRQAHELHESALHLAIELRYMQGICWSIDGIARNYAALGWPEKAAQLFDAEQVLRETHNLQIWPEDIFLHEQGITAARSQLDTASFAAAWAAGQTLTLEQALALAG